MEDQISATQTVEIPLAKISERFGNLRIINPQADRAMLRSMEKYGQMTPVVVSRMEQDHYELLDGFKRLRAGRALSLPSLNARILNLGWDNRKQSDRGSKSRITSAFHARHDHRRPTPRCVAIGMYCATAKIR